MSCKVGGLKLKVRVGDGVNVQCGDKLLRIVCVQRKGTSEFALVFMGPDFKIWRDDYKGDRIA